MNEAVANNITTVLDKLHLSTRIEAIVKAADAGMGKDARRPADGD